MFFHHHSNPHSTNHSCAGVYPSRVPSSWDWVPCLRRSLKQASLNHKHITQTAPLVPSFDSKSE